MTDHLRRELAPIDEAAWKLIDEEAGRTLRHFLAGRALVDFSGPKGWAHSAEPIGETRPLDPGPSEGVTAALRLAKPLVELRAGFRCSITELDRVARGTSDPNLDDVRRAARLAALAEDEAVFHGYGAGSITGIAGASPHPPLHLSSDYDEYPGVVARAVASLRQVGVGGPYAVALGPRCYTGVIETTEHGGYPLLEHMRLILGGPVVWAPAVDGAVVLSVRGGDYEIVCGQDFSIGYAGHSGDTVDLYLEESLTLLVHQPDAAIALQYPDTAT
jgi:uncharacterized linocin/CFP29 family protein